VKQFVGTVVILVYIVHSGLALAIDASICSGIDDSLKRLECFDQQLGPIESKENLVIESPLRKRINSEEKLSKIGEFVIVPHRATYIMPATYMASFHSEPFKDVYGDKVDQIQNVEAKFQISFKVPLWLDIADKDIGLWFGYTQLSLWQLYNAQVSSPFRETNYEPEIALAVGTDFKFLGMNNSYILLGLDHQSNGQSEPLSRSWNRIYLNFVLERNNLVMFLKPWYRIPEDAEDDDNPDIDKYLGYGELNFFYKNERHIWGMRLWNNFRTSNNHTSVQLDWSIPLASGFKGYIQYFNGYGETLIDYNYRNKRIGLGIMLTDWF